MVNHLYTERDLASCKCTVTFSKDSVFEEKNKTAYLLSRGAIVHRSKSSTFVMRLCVLLCVYVCVCIRRGRILGVFNLDLFN